MLIMSMIVPLLRLLFELCPFDTTLQLEWYHFLEKGNCAIPRKMFADFKRARFARFLHSTWK